jgi:hypothetical protein
VLVWIELDRGVRGLTKRARRLERLLATRSQRFDLTGLRAVKSMLGAEDWRLLIINQILKCYAHCCVMSDQGRRQSPNGSGGVASLFRASSPGLNIQ